MKSLTRIPRRVARRVLSSRTREWLRFRIDPARNPPPVGMVSFGDLRRTRPIGKDFGFSRGDAVDRYYIEQFLARHAGDVKGNVLEIGEDVYTMKFGGEQVEKSDVLHVQEGEPGVTIVADLTKADHIPSDSFDCIICTQTIHLLYDPKAAIRTMHRILKPGGTLLVTVSGMGQICRWDMEQWGDCWRYTNLSARRDFETVFQKGNVAVETFGNVLSAVAYMFCLAKEELKREELDDHDPDYQLIIGVRATKEQ